MRTAAVLVATMTGTAELVAEEVAAVVPQATVLPMDNLHAASLTDLDDFIVVSSTYGHGDIPDNGQAFYASVQEALPDLAGKRFAVFALGDMTYADTFCHAGIAWDTLFASCGAERMAPLCCHDASAGTLPEDIAQGWAANLYAASIAA